jgi:hypothetical protein
LAPWDAVRNIYKELFLYLKRDDFDVFKSDIAMKFKEFRDLLDKQMTKKEAMDEINNLKLWTIEEFKKSSKFKDCHKDKIEF